MSARPTKASNKQRRLIQDFFGRKSNSSNTTTPSEPPNPKKTLLSTLVSSGTTAAQRKHGAQTQPKAVKPVYVVGAPGVRRGSSILARLMADDDDDRHKRDSQEENRQAAANQSLKTAFLSKRKRSIADIFGSMRTTSTPVTQKVQSKLSDMMDLSPVDSEQEAAASGDTEVAKLLTKADAAIVASRAVVRRQHAAGLEWILRRQLFGSSRRWLHKASERALRSAFALSTYGMYSPRAYELENNYTTSVVRTPRNRRRITTVKFDPMGVLVAAGRTDGNIAVYDIDEFNLKQQEHDAQSSFGLKLAGTDARRQVQPYILIDTHNDVSAVSWNPKVDGAHLAAAFFSKPRVDVFDLETASDDPETAGAHPLLRLGTGNAQGRGRGNIDVHFIDANCVVALDDDCTLRLWDIRAEANNPQWTLKRAAPPKAPQGCNCFCPSGDGTSLFCSGFDRVFAWDVRHLEFQALSTSCTPKGLGQWEVGRHVPADLRTASNSSAYFDSPTQSTVRPSISSLVANPLNPREWAVSTADGLLGATFAEFLVLVSLSLSDCCV